MSSIIVGAEDRLHNTVHGDTVSIAARLDDLNNELGTTLLLGAATVAQLPDRVFELRALGETQVRGKSTFVKVFAIA